MGMFDRLFSGRTDQTFIRGTGWQDAPEDRPVRDRRTSIGWLQRGRRGDND